MAQKASGSEKSSKGSNWVSMESWEMGAESRGNRARSARLRGFRGAGAPGRSLEQNISENVPTNGIHGSEGFPRNAVKMSLPMAFTALRDLEVAFQFMPKNEPKQ